MPTHFCAMEGLGRASPQCNGLLLPGFGRALALVRMRAVDAYSRVHRIQNSGVPQPPGMSPYMPGFVLLPDGVACTLPVCLTAAVVFVYPLQPFFQLPPVPPLLVQGVPVHTRNDLLLVNATHVRRLYMGCSAPDGSGALQLPRWVAITPTYMADMFGGLVFTHTATTLSAPIWLLWGDDHTAIQSCVLGYGVRLRPTVRATH